MRLFERWPKGREGLFLALAVGVVAALLGSAAAVYTLSDRSGSPDAAASPPGPGDPLVAVVSRPGGFALQAPADLAATKLKRGVKLSTQAKDIVITVGSTGRQGLPAGHATALGSIRAAFPELNVEETVRAHLGDLSARRSVGTVRRARGDGIIFSVTTGVSGRRTWSVVMFAPRDIDPERLQRYYQPVLDSFVVAQAG